MGFFKKAGNAIKQVGVGIQKTKSRIDEFAEKQQQRQIERDRFEYSKLKKQEQFLSERKKTSDLRKRVEKLREQTRPKPMPSMFASSFGSSSNSNILGSSYPLYSDMGTSKKPSVKKIKRKKTSRKKTITLVLK